MVPAFSQPPTLSPTPSILFGEEEPSDPHDPHWYFPLTRIPSLAGRRAHSLSSSHLCPNRPCQRSSLLVYSEMHKVTFLPSVSDSLSWLDHPSQSVPLSDTRLITCLLTICRLKPKEEGCTIFIAETQYLKQCLAHLVELGTFWLSW